MIDDWNDNKLLDITANDKWRIKCITAQAVYDSLSEECRIKISNMVKVTKTKIKGIQWTNALTLVMILLNFQMENKNCAKGKW